MTTSHKVASKASNLLQNSKSEKVKSVSGSALSQAKPATNSKPSSNKSKGK